MRKFLAAQKKKPYLVRICQAWSTPPPSVPGAKLGRLRSGSRQLSSGSLPKISGSLPEQIQDYFSPEVVLEFFPSTSGRVLFLKGRYPVATGRLPLSEIKICWSKPHLWPHI